MSFELKKAYFLCSHGRMRLFNMFVRKIPYFSGYFSPQLLSCRSPGGWGRGSWSPSPCPPPDTRTPRRPPASPGLSSAPSPPPCWRRSIWSCGWRPGTPRSGFVRTDTWSSWPENQSTQHENLLDFGPLPWSWYWCQCHRWDLLWSLPLPWTEELKIAFNMCSIQNPSIDGMRFDLCEWF